MCLRMNSPATNRVGNGGCPGPARQTEPNRPARKPQSISAASRTSGWRRLMISSRAGRNKSSWRSSRGWLMAVPLTANLAVEGITNRPNPESRNARKQQPTTGFLAKSNTCSGQITAIDQDDIERLAAAYEEALLALHISDRDDPINKSDCATFGSRTPARAPSMM